MAIDVLTLRAFTDEMAKIAEDNSKVTPAFAAKVLKNMAIGAGAYGVASATTGLAARKFLPKLVKNKPNRLAVLTGGLGLLSAAGSAALATAAEDAVRSARESSKRDKQE